MNEKDHGFAVLEFENGAHGLIYHSFTVASGIPPYEIHGTAGGFSLQAHDDGRGIEKIHATGQVGKMNLLPRNLLQGWIGAKVLRISLTQSDLTETRVVTVRKHGTR